MTRVLHLTLAFTPGGRRRAITTLLERLPEFDTTCDLVCLDELGYDPSALDAPVGMVECLERRSLLDHRAWGKLVAICRQRGIQVVHAHDAASQFTAACARVRLPRLRLAMTFHRSLGFESATQRDRLRNAWANGLSQAIITGSRERRAHFLAENWVNPRKVVRLPFGIDVGRFQPDAEARDALRRELELGPETTVLGAVGHFGKEKGIDVVLRGYAALGRSLGPGTTALIVVGDGDDAQREALQRLAAEVTGRVIFAGFRRDVERWFQAFDVFVHGARQEAFGLVLAEAMAVGLPVVATRVGGIPDIVRDGQTGLLVPPDQPAALAGALERLVRAPDLRATMGAASARVARAEYPATLYARRHARLYQDLVAGRPPVGVDDEPSEHAQGVPASLSQGVFRTSHGPPLSANRASGVGSP